MGKFKLNGKFFFENGSRFLMTSKGVEKKAAKLRQKSKKRMFSGIYHHFFWCFSFLFWEHIGLFVYLWRGFYIH